MRVLLVYPSYPDTFWSFKHVLKFVSKKAAFPPLGLLTVAAMLPREWEKRLVDVNVRPLTDEDLAWADMVFVSAMIVQRDSAREVIARAGAAGKPVVAGGPIFSAEPEDYPGVDHFVLNEAEVTLPLFLADLASGRPKPMYRSAERPDITTTPAPDWSLISFRDYATMAIQYSRGCPFNCEFCDIIIMNGRSPRTKTDDQIIAELQSLHDAGWCDSVFIVDDNFIGNKASVKRMLPGLIEWQRERGYPFKLLTEASLNLADDPELLDLMSRANFCKVFLGIETPHVDSLRECGKTQNATRDLAEAVRIIHQHGMQVMGGFIVGFDSDTEHIFQAQIEFIQQVGVVTAMVGILNALPRTRLWHRLKAEGRLIGETTGSNTDAFVNFLPKMGTEQLIEGYKSILAGIYSRRSYYRRIHTFVRAYRPTARGRLGPDDMKAFLRSIWRIGILSRARFNYWWLILKTALVNRKAVPAAIELAIWGQHFERVARRALGLPVRGER